MKNILFALCTTLLAALYVLVAMGIQWLEQPLGSDGLFTAMFVVASVVTCIVKYLDL